MLLISQSAGVLARDTQRNLHDARASKRGCVSPERIRIVDSVFHRHGVKADTVGRVEHIAAQTQVEPFGHGEALRQTCVQGKVSR